MSASRSLPSWAAPVAGSAAAIVLGTAAGVAAESLPDRTWIAVTAGALVVVALLAQLVRAWRAHRRAEAGAAVLVVAAPDGSVAGHAVRLRGRRWVVCPTQVVQRALGVSSDLWKRPDRHRTVLLRTPDGGEVEAGVAVWGLAMVSSRTTRLALLRTRRALPWRGGSTLRPVRPGTADRDVTIVLPDPAPATQPVKLSARWTGDVVTIPASEVDTAFADRAEFADRAGGAVVVPAPESDGTCLGLLDVPPAAPPAAGDLQLELLDARPATGWARREVTRRQTLLGVTWAALAGASAGVTSVIVTGGELRGAGWTALFFDPEDGSPAAWAKDLHIAEVEAVSGRDSLRLEADALRRLDFITAPGQLIADQLVQHVKQQTGRDPGRPVPVCHETMMVVARTAFLPAMLGHQLVVRYQGRDGVYLDLTRYLKRCHRTWGSVDRALSIDPGRPVTIDTADPARSGGGVNFLQTLEFTRARMIDSDIAESGFTSPRSLWRTDPRKPGPLARDKAASSTALVGEFTNRRRHLIYTYEHYALQLVAEAHAAGDDDVVALRPRPETRLTQYLLVLSSRGRAVAERMASPRGREALIGMGLRIPREQGVVTARVEQLHRDADASVRRLERAGHPLADTVTWQPVPVDLDKDVVTGLVDLYVADHPAASGRHLGVSSVGR